MLAEAGGRLPVSGSTEPMRTSVTFELGRRRA
jgi:hypothetical protein